MIMTIASMAGVPVVLCVPSADSTTERRNGVSSALDMTDCQVLVNPGPKGQPGLGSVFYTRLRNI